MFTWKKQTKKKRFHWTFNYHNHKDDTRVQHRLVDSLDLFFAPSLSLDVGVLLVSVQQTNAKVALATLPC